MKNPRLIRILALTMLGMATLTMSACHRHRPAAERADWMVNKVTKELDLNEQQQAKLVAVKEAFMAARAQARPKHEAMFGEAVTMVQSEQLDQAKVLELLDRHHAVQREMGPAVIPKLAEFHASLTPEQRTKGVEQLKRLHDRMHGHD